MLESVTHVPGMNCYLCARKRKIPDHSCHWRICAFRFLGLPAHNLRHSSDADRFLALVLAVSPELYFLLPQQLETSQPNPPGVKATLNWTNDVLRVETIGPVKFAHTFPRDKDDDRRIEGVDLGK